MACHLFVLLMAIMSIALTTNVYIELSTHGARTSNRGRLRNDGALRDECKIPRYERRPWSCEPDDRLTKKSLVLKDGETILDLSKQLCSVRRIVVGKSAKVWDYGNEIWVLSGAEKDGLIVKYDFIESGDIESLRDDAKKHSSGFDTVMISGTWPTTGPMAEILTRLVKLGGRIVRARVFGVYFCGSIGMDVDPVINEINLDNGKTLRNDGGRHRSLTNARGLGAEASGLAQVVSSVFRRRGRGRRRNATFWRSCRSTDYPRGPFDNRECLFEDRNGNITLPAAANLDTGLKVSNGMIMSARYARQLGREDQISSDFEDPCLSSISGHSTPVIGILRDVSFRLKRTSVTFKRDFFVCDAIDQLADIMFGAHFLKDHLHLLFEKMKNIGSLFAPWFSAKKESPDEKLEREKLQLQAKIEAARQELARLENERRKSEAAQRSSA
ncbi:metalloprotease [Elasticomyces elasticus]|nr:metalloprotease [Elasticomyces elasticus]